MSRKRKGFPLKRWAVGIFVVGVAMLVSALLLQSFLVGGGDRFTTFANRTSYSNDDLWFAYRFARDNPDGLLDYIPCYCGCGRIGHDSNRDCYVASEADGQVQYEEHASFCDVCVAITLMSADLHRRGYTALAIRQAVDLKFGDVGPPTDTPRPVS